MDSKPSGYAEFMKGIQEYYLLYQTGQKKQANAYLKEFVQKFQCWSLENRYEVLNKFCCFVCETDNGKKLLERGELKQIVFKFLQGKCLQNEMPHLRWYYELFKNSQEAYENGAPDIFEVLTSAYAHKDCDEKTIKYYFDYWLNILNFGAHHFPTGCVIGKREYEIALENCNKISSEHSVPENLLKNAEYYRKLYNAWECYLSEGKRRPFKEYCDQVGITFT